MCNINGESPLHIAVNNSNTKSVRMLLDHDAKTSLLNRKGEKAIHFAFFNGNIDCVRMLLQNCSDRKLCYGARSITTTIDQTT